MSNSPAVLDVNAVIIENGHPTTTSLKVAEFFGKKHKHVLRSIESLDCSSDFNGTNFGLVEYKDAKGELRKAYHMTKDGFMFIAFGFTGKKAAQTKESFIKRFNELEAGLTARLALPYQERRPWNIERKAETIRTTTEAYEALLSAKGIVTSRDLAKQLNITKQSARKRINNACCHIFCNQNGIILRKDKELPTVQPAPMPALPAKAQPDFSGFNFDVLPAGIYKFTVAKAERGLFKLEKECLGLKLTLKIFDVNNTLARIIVEDLFLLKELEWKLSLFFRSIGQKQLGEDFVPDWENLENTGGLCKISVHAHVRGDSTFRRFNDIEFLDPIINLKTLVA